MKTKVSLKRSVERYQEVQRRIKDEIAKLARNKEPSVARVTDGSSSTKETS